MKLDRIGILLGIAGAVLFSTKPILIKLMYAYDLSPVALMALRMGFSLPFYMVFGVIAFRQRKAKNMPTDYSVRTILTAALVGIFGYYIASYLDLEGLTRITAQFERLILFTYPLFVAILGALFLGIRFTRTAATSLILTYFGLAIIFAHDFKDFGSNVLTGTLLVLAASAVFAGFIVFSKGPIEKLGSRMFTTIAMITASIAILLHFLIFYEISDLYQPWQVYGLAMAVAVIATVIPTFLIAESIARIGPGPASIMGSIGPVFTTFMAVIFLGEKFTIAHFFGTILIIAGVAWLAYKNNQPSV